VTAGVEEKVTAEVGAVVGAVLLLLLLALPPQHGAPCRAPDEGGHQRPSEVIRGHQRPSEVIRGHQRYSSWRSAVSGA
jgi:hypothetical protein